ncbi:MAG: HprK-related kinase A [Pseudomonadota bacterium]|nr:HprK-related kinase A [Pseudomonadota bacterium]MDP1905101.1 HprK-related kinase A [Pseudomonadota bacterium]MDP2354416.1 HprK-related kinase A [Pseudomonadota bacterium]
MNLGDLAPAVLRRQLATGIDLRTGPFRFLIRSHREDVARGLATLYPDFPLEAPGFRDFHVRVDAVSGPRRWYRPQCNFWHDGHAPFKPLPLNHAFPLLEWGMNWCIAGHAQHYLMLHAAVLERHGKAVILPGDPGAGKSTLTAALALSGWRLLSDEITLIDRDDGLITPLARPISLKNQSIDLIRAAFPTAVIGDSALDTHKGTVAHLKPPRESVARMADKARAAHIVFPRWRAQAPARLSHHSKADAFIHAATHGFNYSLLGRLGFELNAALIDSCDCWDFEYDRLEDALATFEELVA